MSLFIGKSSAEEMLFKYSQTKITINDIHRFKKLHITVNYNGLLYALYSLSVFL